MAQLKSKRFTGLLSRNKYAIGLIAMCLVRIPSPHVRMSFAVVVEYAVMWMLAVYIYSEINRWAGLMLALMTFSSFFPAYTKYTYVVAHGVLLAFIWYAIVYHVGPANCLLDALCVVALANVAFLVLQYFNMDPLFEPIGGGHDLPVGMMCNRNEVSALLAITASAFMRPKRWFGLAFIATGLILAQTFGGVLAFGAGVCFYLVMTGHPFLGVIAPLEFMLCYLLAVDAPGMSERWKAWGVACKLWWTPPEALKQGLIDSGQGWKVWLLRVIGYGAGHFPVVFPIIEGKRWGTLHCDWLQGILESGPMFLSIVVGYLVSTYRSVKRLYRKEMLPAVTGLVIIVVNCSYNFLFHIGTTAIIAVTLLAILQKQIKEAQNA